MVSSTDKKNIILGRLAFLATSVIWGSSFFINKIILDQISALHLVAFRFTLGAILTAFLCIKSLRKLDAATIKAGAVMGVLLFAAYVFQTVGLVYTTPAKNAFLTSTYCIIVPFLYWLIEKKRPDRYNIISAVLCVIGIGLVSLQNDLTLGLGDLLSTSCGLFFALHILAINRLAPGKNIILLNMVQFAVVAALSWVWAPFTAPFPERLGAGVVLSALYLAVMCTVVCYFLQTFGQKYTQPSDVAVIMTLESVFGSLCAVIFYDEKLTLRPIIGFCVIFLSVLISETKLNFLARGKRRPETKLPM